MKIIIGAANIGSNYGLNKSGINSISKIKQIFAYIRKNNINTIDDAISYKGSKKILNKVNLENFKFISKIKLTKNYKSTKDLNYYFYKHVKKSLEEINKKKYYCILGHNVYKSKSKNLKLISALKYLKKKKITDKIGISVYNPEEIKYILKLWKPQIIQSPLNVFDQRLINGDIIQYLKKKKIELHVRSIFLQGSLVSHKTSIKLIKFRNEFKIWEKWCKNKKINRLKACVHFIKKFKKISSVVIGINNLEQIKEIIKYTKQKTININYLPNIKKIKIIDPRKW